MNRCRKGCTWTGLSRCHCSACHETFGGITGFDMHRRGSRCSGPENLGLKQNGAGIWVTPARFSTSDSRTHDVTKGQAAA